MYESILKTLKENILPDEWDTSEENTAREIASRSDRFTLWCINEVTFEHNMYFDIDGNIVDNEGNYLYTTIEHVFAYWLNNIEKPNE